MTTRTLGRHLMLAVAWGCVAFGGAMMMLYLVPRLQFSRSKLAMAAAFIPYGIVAWALAAVLFLAFARGRPRGFLALLAAAALAGRPHSRNDLSRLVHPATLAAEGLG